MTVDEFRNVNITIRPGVVVLDASPVLGDGVWRPYSSVNAHGPYPPGWYAYRTEKRGHNALCQLAGRFGDEADCRFWCDAFNRGTAEEQERARQLADPVPGF